MAVFRLVSEDCAVTLAFGGIQGAAGPNYPTAASVKAIAKSISISGGSQGPKFKALGDQRESMRVTAVSEEITLTLYVASTGPVAYGRRGSYVEVIVTPLSSLTTGSQTYYGVVTNVDTKYDANQEQTEEIKIFCDAE